MTAATDDISHLIDSEEQYENPFRQSSVLPYRLGAKGFEVMMITSIKRRRWIIPKGIVEPNMTPWDSAAKEALEEAGIEGDVSSKKIGRYHYEKWGGLCRCDVFTMRVTQVHETWPESAERDRAWIDGDEARRRLRHKKLRAIVGNFIERTLIQ